MKEKQRAKKLALAAREPHRASTVLGPLPLHPSGPSLFLGLGLLAFGPPPSAKEHKGAGDPFSSLTKQQAQATPPAPPLPPLPSPPALQARVEGAAVEIKATTLASRNKNKFILRKKAQKARREFDARVGALPRGKVVKEPVVTKLWGQRQGY